MDNKKTKLTISGTAKKTIKNIEIAKTQSKNAVVIEKQSNKFTKKTNPYKSSNFKTKASSMPNRGFQQKPSFQSKAKTLPVSSDFERRP